MSRELIRVLSAALITVAAQCAHAKPVVEFNIDYYTVTGNTVAQIQNSMLANTPIREGNKTFGGLTTWKLDSTYRARESADGGCEVIDPVVYLNVRVTLPKLVPGPKITVAARKEWERFLGALRAHEKLHAVNGLYTAQTLEKRLTNLKTGFDCARTKQLLAEASRALIANIGKKDIEMDRTTNHGATQGAYLKIDADRQVEARR